jgi:alkaline phosphatase
MALILVAPAASAEPPTDNPEHPAFPHPMKDDTLPDPTVSGSGPTVNVWPNHGVRFAPGQRFDIRVEGTGTGPVYNFSASLKINGTPQAFTSGSGDSVATDGISTAGWGGFNLRGYSLDHDGIYTMEATFTSSQGTKIITQSIVIEKLANVGTAKVKNIIFLLGDGMSISHRTAARVVRYGVQAGTPKGWLAMDKFPTQGMVSTFSLNSYVTDSAPGMSGYTTGSHHNNNQEGVFPAQVTNKFFQPRVEYIAE